MVNSSGCLLRLRCERSCADLRLTGRIVSSASWAVELDFTANYPQIFSTAANLGSARSRFVESNVASIGGHRET
jgi:hypothetical protein